MNQTTDRKWMDQAIELARRGQGRVEPNPLVGCVLERGGQLIAEGWHHEFGGDHAEVAAIKNCPGPIAGATAYVTLEPCCHHGKTPPCTQALIQGGIQRVVIGHLDPFSKVSGAGVRELRAAGVEVQVGVQEAAARALNLPYLHRIQTGLPWIIAKWAMTLDGRIATTQGESQWISNESSRAVVHEIRGKVDGILVGIGTALADDPQLTARPAGPRMATRIVLDSRARLALDSKLAKSARDVPCLIVTGPQVDRQKCRQLEQVGCQIWFSDEPDYGKRTETFLRELVNRGMTNILVEGGNQVLGCLFEQGLMNECHIFLGPKLFGGQAAPGPIGGSGAELIAQAAQLENTLVQLLDTDVYIRGNLIWPTDHSE